MKKQITSSLLRRIFTTAFLVSVLFMNVANAAEDKSGKAASYELKYIGKLDEQPVFQLNIENVQKENVYLRLEDEAGNALYSNNFSEKNFSKKLQFDISEGTTKIRMILISKNLRQTQMFSISNIEKVVENVVVTKVH